MKKYLFTAFTLTLITFSAMSITPEEVREVKAEAKPHQVTVFLTGAELRYKSSVTLVKGKNLVKFIGLSAKLDPNSIVVDVEKKNVVILSVFSNNNFLAMMTDNPKIKPIRDSIEILKDELAMLRGRKEAMMQEKELLYKNDVILGREKGQPVADIEKSADFFRKRVGDLNADIYKLTKQETKWAARLDLLAKQFNELNLQINPPSSEITVLVLAGDAGACGFELKYRVVDAGWAPKYDIRVDAVAKPVNLYYKAQVYNNTGVDWVEVKMKLSTSDPLQGAQYPKLDEWSLTKDNNYTQSIGYQSNYQQIQKVKQHNKEVDFKIIEVDELNAEFDIALPYTIPSDNKPYLVDVTSKALEARYEYISIPKMDKDAYLIAKVVGWGDLNLVSGNASIYFGGTYIGQSKISIIEISDTLELSLGRDSKIAISRVKKSEVNDHQFIGNYEKEIFKYEIIVKNNRDVPLLLTIQDQVPVENDSRIDVNIAELSGGVYNKNNGMVTWTLNLNPGDTKTLIFNFSAKYPKGLKPKKKKYRTISSPSF